MCSNRYGGVFSSRFVETVRKLRRETRKEWKEKLGDERSLVCLDGKYVVAHKMYSNSWGCSRSKQTMPPVKKKKKWINRWWLFYNDMDAH